MREQATSLKGVLVGCGYASEFQLKAWSRIESAEIVAVSSMERSDAENRAAEYDVPAVFDNYEAMLDEVQPDFVDIATPAATHLELVTAAAERGVHVLCQKPMATSLDDVDAMNQVCEANGATLTVNENARFQPWFRALGQVVRAGTLGPIRSLRISSRARMTLPEPDFGGQDHLIAVPRLITMDLGVHHLDVARYLLGEADNVFAVMQHAGSQVAGEDMALIVTTHEGVPATIDMSWATPPYPDCEQISWSEVRVEGDDGAALLGYDAKLEIWTPASLASSKQFADTGVQEGYKAMQRHFVDSLASGIAAETSGRESARTMDLVFAAYKSAATNVAVTPGAAASA